MWLAGEDEAVARRMSRGEEMENDRRVGDEYTEIEDGSSDNDDLEE